MARKSQGFKELLAEQKACEDKYRMIERIKQRSQSVNDGGLIKDVIIDAEGHEKMSDIMNDFLAPYLETVDSISDYKKLLSLGVIAWNASLLPEHKEEEFLDLFATEMFGNIPADTQEDIYWIIDELIDRKKKYFDSIKRLITDYTARDRGRDYHLSIVWSEIE